MSQSYRVQLQENGGWSETSFETPPTPVAQADLPAALQKALPDGVLPMVGFVSNSQQQKLPAFMLFDTSMQLWGKACTSSGQLLHIEGP
jgi:hypothetical protein